MRVAALAAVALLAACEQRVPTPEENDAFARDLANLSAPKEEEPPAPEPALNLLPLQPGDVEAALGQAQPCDFAAGGRILFAAAGRAGVARINGLAVRMGATLPTGPTGGFFEGQRFAISVGRLADDMAPVEGTTSWPAKLILTERVGDRPEQRLEGVWRCPTGTE
jgi:hypothetical protein